MIAAGVLLFGSVIARADDFVVLDRTASDFDTWGMQPDGRERVVMVISRETGLPVTVLETQRQTTQLGYGGLFIANSLAAESGRGFDEIVALKRGGRGWGDIARQYNVNLGSVVSRTHRADVAFHENGNVKRDEMKAEKFVNGHDARDGKLDGTGKGVGHAHAKAGKVVRLGKGKNHGDAMGHGNGKGHGGGKGHK